MKYVDYELSYSPHLCHPCLGSLQKLDWAQRLDAVWSHTAPSDYAVLQSTPNAHHYVPDGHIYTCTSINLDRKMHRWSDESAGYMSDIRPMYGNAFGVFNRQCASAMKFNSDNSWGQYSRCTQIVRKKKAFPLWTDSHKCQHLPRLGMLSAHRLSLIDESVCHIQFIMWK